MPPLRPALLVALLALAAAILTACPPEQTPTNAQSNGNTHVDDPFIKLSDGGLFRVELTVPARPLPFQEIFSLEIHVEDPATDAPLTALTLEPSFRVADVIPVLPTSPQIEEIGQGTYRIDGLLFHVPQRWELRLDIIDASGQDRVTFDLGPTGQYVGALPEDPTQTFNEADLRHILTMSPAPPPPPDPTNAVADDDAAAHLGQFLFFDTRFSEDGTVACASCHAADHGFSDPDALSTGLAQTDRRAMPALNAAYQRWAFWDGRTDSLWAQALGPIENEVEHGISRTELVHHLYQDPALRDAYEAIFSPLPEMNESTRFPDQARPVPDDPDHPHHQAWLSMSDDDRFAINQAFANFGKAIAAYERRLIRNDAPFDRFVEALIAGDETGLDALSDQARQGLKVFLNDGRCVDCHGGHQLSNFEFHNLGLGPRSWLPDAIDSGRSQGLASLKDSSFNAAGPHSDAPDSQAAALLAILPEPDFLTDGAFKTPTLRNIAERSPYMHGGHLASLEEVVDFYSDLQEDSPVGLRDPLLQQVNLSPDDAAALVAFMESLTGDPLPDELVQPLESPSP